MLGTSVGIATGGVAIAGTVPCAVAGATTGAAVGGSIATTIAGWLGVPIATTTTVATAPFWAVPVAVAGGAVAVAAIGYRIFKSRRAKKSLIRENCGSAL